MNAQPLPQPTVPSLFFRSNGWMYALHPWDILFVQSSGNYCDIQTVDQKITIKKSLSYLVSTLEPHGFRRVHRSFLIGLRHIDRINPTDGLIEIGEHQVPLGRKYREPLFDTLQII